MHIADPDTGNLGANAIVGGSAGIATGAALSAKMRGSGQVAVCFFGDGALGQGLLYEVMNMAALWKLPVIYVCENNLYNEYTHYSRDDRRRDPGARPGLRDPGRKRRRPGRAGRPRRRCAGSSIARAVARAGVPGLQYLPLPWPSRRRRQPRVLPLEAGRAEWKTERDPIKTARRTAHRAETGRSSRTSTRSQAEVKTEMDDRRAVRRRPRRIPTPSKVDRGCLCLKLRAECAS